MPKVGVLLSGCGVFDGSEIHESVLTLLALDDSGAEVVCCAPNIDCDVIDHRTKASEGERNVLTESARIARGDIVDLSDVSAADLDAIILPGGFGAAKNLSNFATAGGNCEVNGEVDRVLSAMLKAGKPIGVMCIAPGTMAKVAQHNGVQATLTIGNDADTAAAIEQTGCKHQAAAVDEIVVDAANKIVSTPAYMLATGPAEANQGIRKLVKKVLEMAG